MSVQCESCWDNPNKCWCGVHTTKLRVEPENGWPLCEHTRPAPGCVACAYRQWCNAGGPSFTSHTIPYAGFIAGYIAGRACDR